MYCPQCGQMQSEDARYCSRCGLWLYEMGLWLNGGGVPGHSEAKKKQVSPRRKAMLRAAKVTFFSVVLLPFGAMFAKAVREPVFVILPLFSFMISLVWILYCLLFMDGTAAETLVHKPFSKPPEKYMPPVSAVIPSALEAHRVNTSEMIQPPSVTEYTTNLLKKERS